MLEKFLNQISKIHINEIGMVGSIAAGLAIVAVLTGIFYVFLFYVLRPIARQFERDIAIVSLSVCSYPALIVFAALSLKIVFDFLGIKIWTAIDRILISAIIMAVCYAAVQLFIQVFIYYVKQYTQKSEAMWDDVLLPIASAVFPVVVYTGGFLLVINTFGVNLAGLWVTLGGATFVLGFALQDILANFFSGIVLLVDAPFRFGDILCLEDGTVGMLRRIGIRVTHLYIFRTHCDIYIPNSVLQGQIIKNLSRPTSLYYQSLIIGIPPEYNLDEAKKLIAEVVSAHPDTLGQIDNKLGTIEQYYISEEGDEDLNKQQNVGKLRLLAEQEVNSKLEEIEQDLQALVVTMQFAEKGGLTQDEAENVRQEYKAVLELMGYIVTEEANNNRTVFNLEENSEEGLLELIRAWYRNWIQDPNLLENDQYFILEEWERKLGLLTRRVQRLYQKISNPQADETRLDDDVADLIKWIKDKLKVPREEWQEPRIRMKGMSNAEALFYVELEVMFFVDDLKLEDGRRGDRVRSQIYQEVFRHLKSAYINWNGIQEKEVLEENGNGVSSSIARTPDTSFVQTGFDPATAKQGFAFYLSVGKNKSAIKPAKTVEE